jgi:hypothetical protein
MRQSKRARTQAKPPQSTETEFRPTSAILPKQARREGINRRSTLGW